MRAPSPRWLLLAALLAPAPSLAQGSSHQRENAQFWTDTHRLGSSCADLAELTRIAGTVSPNAASLYRAEVDRRRTARVSEIDARLRGLMAQGSEWNRAYFAAGDTPDGARADIVRQTPKEVFESAHAATDELSCYEPDRAVKLRAAIDSLQETIDRVIAEEAKCRATPACVGDRIAKNLCVWTTQRRAAMADIATEKKNPSGVVDLVKLHDLGQAVQDFDQQLAAGKKQYTATLHKPFSESLCARAAP